MNIEQAALLGLTSSAILQRQPQMECLSGLDWNELFLLTVDARLQAIVYDVAAAMQGEAAPPEALMLHWKTRVINGAFRQMDAQHRAAKVLVAFRNAGISCVIFKGPVLADLYSAASKRFSKDLDMLVSEEELEAAEAVFQQLGMQLDGVASKDCVRVWGDPGSLQVEMHTCLWEDYQGDQVERLKEMHLTDPNSLLSLESSVGSIVTMGHTEHLVYQMFHAIKHLLYKGMSLRVLTDTTLFINRYLEQIDVERFWKSMDQLKYTRFCLDMFRVCEKYFGLDSRAFPQDFRGREGDLATFLDALMEVCLRNMHNQVYDTASGAIFQTFLKTQEGGKQKPSTAGAGRVRVMARLLFPEVSALSERYAYAKKCPILLPIAWIHRAIDKLFRKKDGEAGFRTMKQGLSVASRRVGLLQEYDLLD